LRIEVYTQCWNEERFLPYFLRHYGAFASLITILDNESTDRSADIARSYPNTRVLSYGTGGELRDDVRRDNMNACWKEAAGRADWVIVVDTDELVYHHRLLDYLGQCQKEGITLPWTTGYDMVSKDFPTTSGQVYEEIRLGVQDDWYSKPVVFDPGAITEINFVPGAHTCNPVGEVVEDHSGDLKLLHFRFLGLDYVLPRFESRRQRQSATDIQEGLGYHLRKKPREIKRWFKALEKKAQPVL
jgi:glycosyltransferase involved in cell wall biosynthesis